MSEDFDDATLSLVAHNLRGAIGIAVGATRTVRLRWASLDEARRDELLQLAERGMARVDDAVFGIARGLPAEVIADLQSSFDAGDEIRTKSMEARPYPIAEDEDARLEAVRRYHIVGEGPAADLDAIVRVAARVAGSTGAAVNIIDADLQWTAAAVGLSLGAIPREDSMCAYAIYEGGTVNIPDSSLHPMFASNPHVSGALGNMRLYAAVPLVAPVSHPIGTICVFDDEPRVLDDGQIAALEDLARIVTSLFEERALAAELRQSAIWQHELIADLERERQRNEHLLERLGTVTE